MVGGTLSDIRARLTDLSVAVGPYRVVSSKTGDSPVPVSGLQFPDRERGAEAATLAAAYRRALRRYDPHVAVHGLVVTETGLGETPSADDTESLPEYCHTVAGVLFETLSDRHGRVERRVMDTYLDAAEGTTDRERLCLRMLESTATALAAHLTPSEQATVIRGAVDRLPPRASPSRPLVETLETLQARDVLRSYTVEPTAEGTGRRSLRVTLDGYRPSLSDGRCPILPVAVELFRHAGVAPSIGRVRRTDTGWAFVVTVSGDSPPRGLSVVPTSG